eukprot:964768-Heterocapsa_arctica.AAC.1
MLSTASDGDAPAHHRTPERQLLGPEATAPNIPNPEAQTAEVKALLQQKLGEDLGADEDAEADEQPVQQSGGKFRTLSRSHHRTLEHQYLGSEAPAPKISDLEAQTDEVKAIYKQKFGEDCDADEDVATDEQPVQQTGG